MLKTCCSQVRKTVSKMQVFNSSDQAVQQAPIQQIIGFTILIIILLLWKIFLDTCMPHVGLN